MRIVVAFDKFKGSFSAAEACRAAESGLRSLLGRIPGGAALEIDHCPIADGGEGTLDVLVAACGGTRHQVEVTDALGRPVQAAFGVVPMHGLGSEGAAPDGEPRRDDSTRRAGVIEMSAASGLAMLGDEPLDPWRATTFGTGQLVAAAADRGVDQLVVGLGGSATNDAGAGMALALGARFLDRNGREIVKIPEKLADLNEIGLRAWKPLPPVLVASDVVNPLLGERGATRVFGPQKGVGPDQLSRHEARLAGFADRVAAALGRDPREQPGAGAAGGLGFALLAFCRAEIRSGFDLVADLTRLRQRIERADLVVTGEGRIDSQTLEGKGPAGVGRLAKGLGKPVVAIAGQAEPGVDYSTVFDLVVPLVEPGDDPTEAIAEGHHRLTRVAAANHRLQDLLDATNVLARKPGT